MDLGSTSRIQSKPDSSPRAEGGSDHPHATSREFRKRRIRLAVASGIASKVATATLSLGAIPLVRRGLGVEGFVTFGRYSIVLMWASMLNIGVGPAATLGIAESLASNRPERTRRFVTTTYLVALAAGLCLLTVLGLGLGLAWVFTGAQLFQDFRSSSSAFPVLAILFLLLPLGSATFAVLAGVQEIHRSNTWQVVGSLAASSSIVYIFIFQNKGGAVLYLASMFGVPLFAKMAAGLGFGRRHREIRPSWRYRDADVARSLVSANGAYSLAQVGGWLGFQSSVYFVSNSNEAATLFTMISLIVMGVGLLSSLILASMPAIRVALVQNDISWIHSRLKTQYLLLIAICGLGALASMVGGATLLQEVFYDPNITTGVCLAGVFVFGCMLFEFITFHFLLAVDQQAGTTLAMVLYGLVGILLLSSGGSSMSAEDALIRCGLAAAVADICMVVLLARWKRTPVFGRS